MNPKVSIVISTFNREQILKRLLYALKTQTFQDFEIIISDKEGPLVEARDSGWRKAKGEIIVWCDDDIIPTTIWLQNIVAIFDTRKDIVGVTGPTEIMKEYRKNRDIFKEGLFKKFYNWFFLEGKAYLPGRITSCGVNTIGANYDTKWSRERQFVDFLEPSHFAVRKWVVEEINGFDMGYGGVGEWTDVDLSFRARDYGKLLYHPEVKVKHCPINDGIKNKRKETKTRYENYCKFADKFGYTSFKNKLYRLFLKIYFLSVKFMN
jgi:GT2 family glycosyltransferase